MVRIRSHTGEVVGSGFVVATGHVVTCAHVVARALGRKTQEAPAETDTVSLDFPLVAAGVTVQARVAVWHPIEDDDKGDIAVLALVSDPPAGVLPAYLVAAEDFWSHPFRTFGFPRRYDHGVWASGVLRARQAAGWVQMETTPSGYAIEAGFSGAAVWDDELAGVVGMTVAADARRDRGAAYLIPTEELIRAWPQLADRTVPPCPYRGLYPFRERDARVFYGRQDLTDLLVAEVRRRPLVAVVGPSGSGKSSVVFAGLLPQIVQQQEWLCLRMRPAHASSPLAALAAAFLLFLDPDRAETERLVALGQLTTLLREGHLPDVVDRVLTRAGKTDLLLVVDQCEELFAREAGDASEFLTVLLPVPHTPRSLTVVLTLRADFLGQALQDPALAAALEGSVTTIGQMGRDQLRAVIEGPLPKDVTYEAGLVERILGDVGEEPGSLPLLEFALTLLWERQDRGTLTHSAYEQLGGVSGALASYAERVYLDQLLPDDQEEARRLLIQLIRPSEVGQPVRRIARRPELGEPRWQLAQRLAATRLLVTDRDPTGVESVELVHEALITRWSRLSEWFAADLAFRTWQEQLRASLAQWEAARRDEGALLRGTPLAEAERWLTEHPEDLGPLDRQFIHASRALRTRSLRRLRMVVAVLALLVVVASSLGGVALWQSKRASEKSKLAQSRALVTQANSLASSQPDVAMLLAAAAYQTTPTRETITALTSIANRWQDADRLLTTDMKDIFQITFSPTDPTMVALTSPHGIELWDVKSNTRHRRGGAEGVGASAFSRDGRILAYTQKNEQGNKVVLWSHTEDQIVREIPLDLTPEEYAGNLAFDSGGKLLGVCVGKRIQLWSLDTGRLHRSVPLTHDGNGCAFGFRNNSRELAYIDSGSIITWDIAASVVITKNRLSPPKRRRSSRLPSTDDQFFFGPGSSFTVAPDGRSAIYEGEIREVYSDSGRDRGSSYSAGWWDFDRQQEQEIEPDGFPIQASFTPDGRRAAVSRCGGITIFDAAKRTPIATYPTATNFGIGAFSPDGHTIAMADQDGSNVIALIDTDLHHGIPTSGGQVAIRDNEHLTVVSSGKVAIYSSGSPAPTIVRDPTEDDRSSDRRVDYLSPDGLHYAFTDDRRQQVRLLDVSSPPAPEMPLEGDHSEVLRPSFDPRSEFLAYADKSEIIVWSVKTRTKTSSIPLSQSEELEKLAVGPGGRYIAAISSNGEARLWDTRSDDHVGISIPFADARSVSFSPDGTRLSMGSQNEIKIWNLNANKFDPQLIPAGGLLVKFSPDGSRLATIYPRPIPINGLLVKFGPLGRLTATDSEHYQISVWNLDMRGPTLEGTVDPAGELYDFALDNSRLVVGAEGVFVEPFDASWALNHVCRIVTRKLTPEEWNQYLPGSDYTPPC